MKSPQDTITALATPPGESGIGVIRLSGPKAIPITAALFKPAKPLDLAAAATHTCHFGRIVMPSPPSPLPVRGEGGPARFGTVGEGELDHAVVTLFRAPHSYTGDDVVEISAHGSPYILNQVLQACVKQGARPAEPGEFTERAFLAGKMDLTQAEAVADLIRARTDQSHAAALAQLDGHLAKHVRGLRDSLLPLLAHVEVGLDHSDEDHDFLPREKLTTGCRKVQDEIEALLASVKVGKILREGLRIALVGRPNVGKSSLMNALLKEDRAIVTPIPGTTRDTLEESVDWEGIPVVLTDTAGVHDAAQDPVEVLGMERTRKALQSADLVLCLFDASEPLTAEDKSLIAECSNRPHLWVANKADLVDLTPVPSPDRRGGVSTLSHRERVPQFIAGGEVISVSAKTGHGLNDLVSTVKQTALAGSTASGEIRWALNSRHQAALQRAHTALIHAAEAAQKEAYEECVALELHTALGALGEIIGETATEDLLGEIFSKFCIGK